MGILSKKLRYRSRLALVGALVGVSFFSGCQVRVFRSEIHRLRTPTDGDESAGPALPAVAEIAVSGNPSVVAGQCSGALTLRRLDDAGVSLVLPSATSVGLSGAATGQFYSDGFCTTPISAATIPGGSNSVDVYYSDTVAAALSLDFTVGGAIPGAHPLTVVADAPHALVFSGATTAAANACVAITIEREDQYGNPAAPASATAVTLGGVGSGNFFTSNTCATTTTTRSIASGSSNVVAYYRNRYVEAAVTLTASGLTVNDTHSFAATGPFALPTVIPPALTGLPATFLNVLTAADFNGDGNRDVAVSGGFAVNNVYVLPGNGSGGFTSGATLATAQNPMQVEAVSLRNNGVADLVVTNFGQTAGTNNLSVFLGNGNGTFQAPAHYASTGKVGASGIAVSTNLLNTAGRFDVVVSYEGDSGSSYASSGVEIFPGNGDGTLGAATSFSTSGTQLDRPVLGDLNGDGNMDFTVPLANDGDANAKWFRNDGGGTGFTPFDINPGGGFRGNSWAFGFFNADALLDFTIGIAYAGIFASNGNGGTGFSLQLVDTSLTDFDTRRALTGVLTSSGHTDLIHLGANPASVRNGLIIYLGNGDGTFANALFYRLASHAKDVVRGDFDGDGKLDLVVLTEGGDLHFFKKL